MAESSDSLVANNADIQKECNAVVAEENTGEQKTEQVMEPMLLEEHTTAHPPATLNNLLQSLRQQRQQQGETAQPFTSHDIVSGLVYVLLVESGFVPVDTFGPEEGSCFSYRRLLHLSRTLPTDWRRKEGFSLVLQPFQEHVCRVVFRTCRSNLLVNCCIGTIEDASFTITLVPSDYVIQPVVSKHRTTPLHVGEHQHRVKATSFHVGGEHHQQEKATSFHDDEHRQQEKVTSFHDGEHHQQEKVTSFHDGEHRQQEKVTSFRDGEHHQQEKVTSFHIGEHEQQEKVTSFHDGEHRQQEKVTSFHDGEHHQQDKVTSFHIGDHEQQEKVTSFHVGEHQQQKEEVSFQNLRRLSRIVKDHVGFPAKCAIFRRMGGRLACLEHMPDEVLLQILERLHVRDLLRLGKCSGRLKVLTQDPKLLHMLLVDFITQSWNDVQTLSKVFRRRGRYVADA